MSRDERVAVGSLRRSQTMFAFGVGATVDLPGISVMVMGLDEWSRPQMVEVGEERLLAAVRRQLGSQVERLYLPPIAETDSNLRSVSGQDALIGLPVSTF